MAARIRPPFLGSKLDINVDDLVATADRVAVRGTLSGAPSATRLDAPPEGRITIDHARFCRVEAGRIAGLWSLPDGLGLLEQLDVLPSRSQFGRRLSDREDSEK